MTTAMFSARQKMMSTTLLLVGGATLLGGAFAFLRPSADGNPGGSSAGDDEGSFLVAESAPMWTLVEEGDGLHPHGAATIGAIHGPGFNGGVGALDPFARLVDPMTHAMPLDQMDQMGAYGAYDVHDDLTPAQLAWIASEGRLGSSPLRLYLVYAPPPVPRAFINRMWGWMLGLGAMALTALGLFGLRRLRPVGTRVTPTRPAPVLFALSILGPLLPQLVLLHSDCQLLPSLLMIAASAGIGGAGAMLIGRKQLLQRLRWTGEVTSAAGVGASADGEGEPEMVAECLPQKLTPALGASEATVWYRGDVTANVADGAAPVRIALEGAWVDDVAAAALADAAHATPNGETITVVGWATRVPASAEAAPALCRGAGEQLRVVGSGEPLVLLGGSRTEALRALRLDIALLGGALALSAGAALLALS